MGGEEKEVRKRRESLFSFLPAAKTSGRLASARGGSPCSRRCWRCLLLRLRRPHFLPRRLEGTRSPHHLLLPAAARATPSRRARRGRCQDSPPSAPRRARWLSLSSRRRKRPRAGARRRRKCAAARRWRLLSGRSRCCCFCRSRRGRRRCLPTREAAAAAAAAAAQTATKRRKCRSRLRHLPRRRRSPRS